MLVVWRRARVGAVGLLVLASCFHGSVTPTATLAPSRPDAVPPRTKGPFAVVYAAPKGHVVDRKQPGVTVLFSRGVRSVEMADDERLPAIAIKTKAGAPVAGSWRWTGTRGLLFTPDGELPGGNDFVVTVPPDVKALDGSVLGAPYTLAFETDGPKVDAVTVVGRGGATEKAMPPDASFRVQFDQSVDPSAVALASTLRTYKVDGDKGEPMKLTAAREVKGKTAPPGKVVPESYVVVLKPEKPLPLDQQVDLTIGDGLRGTGGPRPMGAPVTRSMRTHGPLRFVDFYCPRLEAKGRCRANGDVKVIMSTPVAPDELKRHVKADKLPPRPPAKAGKAQPRPVDPTFEHWLGVAPKLGESYKVTLTAGMKDVYGQKLEKDASFEIVVESPLVKPPAPPPGAAPATPPPPPVHVAKGEGDARPRRERLPYRLDVGLQGHVLEAALDGVRHKVPVGAVNVPTYATMTSSLTDAQAIAWSLARGSTTDFLTRNALVSSWVSNNADVNQRSVDFLDLDAALAKRSGRGPVLLVVGAPGSVATGVGRTESLVNVTNLGVTAKMSPFGGLVWVTELATGKPKPGAIVEIRTAKGDVAFQGATDGQGLVIVPADRFNPIKKEKDDGEDSAQVRDDAAIVVHTADDWTLTKIAHSSVEQRLTSSFQSLSKEGHWAGMLFADRGVFRPGETAKVSGIVRVAEASGLRSIPGRELRIELKTASGEQIFDGRSKCDDFGTFSLDLPIPKTAEIGMATITATALGGGKTNTSESGVFSHEIRILEFKPNEFAVTVEPNEPSYVRGDTATFTTHGDYLYGAPMQGASVTTTVSRQEVPFTPPNTEGLVTTDDVATGDYADDTKAAEQVDSQDGALDAHGVFARQVSLSFSDQRRPERVIFDADVQDLSRRDVSARSSVIVHPGEFYVALKPPKDRFVAAGAPLRAEVLAVEPNGNRRAGVKVKVELVERRWNSVTGQQPDGRPLRSSKAEDTVLTSCDAVTTAAGSGCDVRVPHAGYFIVRATATDTRDNSVRASTSIYGTEESPRATNAWPADDRHGIKLETNQKKYAIGDTAKVVLRSPFKEGSALVTVERNGVLFQKVMPIKGPVPVVEIPIKPELYPNAFVSVVALRGRVQAPPASGADLGAPDYRYGWTELKVDQEAHRLKVSVTGASERYQPGATVETDVVVQDGAGKPVPSALTFYVVDEGVLALTSYATPDPLPAFVQPRKLSVFTLDNREDLAHILPMKAGERLSPLGYEYALARSGDGSYDKGDDGGGGDGLKRADFRTTAYFEAGRRTDANGKAHFSFKLPDNLTTFRVMAVAAAADDRFGSGASKVTTYRQLMARPALPRFIRVGDALEASVIISTKPATPHDRRAIDVDVSLDAKGLVVSGPKTRRITTHYGDQAEVRFPVKAAVPGDAVLSFEARSGSDVDRVEMKRKVDLPSVVESSAVYGETDDRAAIALGDLTAMRRDFGGLRVRMSSSALVGLGATLDRLAEYPYGCTEQLSSKVLPLISLMDLAKDGGVHMPANANAAIDGALETIVKRQRYDGGWGFWDKSESVPWLSAYTMLALAGASERKHFVSRDILEQGRSYLNVSLSSATRRLAKMDRDADESADAGTDEKRAERREAEETSKAVDYVNAALLADTLASLGWPNPGALNLLYDVRAGRRLSAQAMLLHGMAKADMNPAQLKTLAGEIESRLRVGPNGIDVDEPDDNRYDAVLDSHARTLALVLRGLLAANPKHPYAPRIARRLLSLRQNGAWRTTQEDAWALLALADYRRLQESAAGGIEARAFLGGNAILESKFPRGSLREDTSMIGADVLLAKGPTLSFDVRGGGPLFFAAELKYATSMLPTRPRDEGLFVTKYVRGVAPAEATAALTQIPKRTAESVTAGDLVIVDLLFESAEPRDQVVLDDPLPAGLEALDYDLDTTSKAGRDAENKPGDPKATWLGTTFRTAPSRREVRDERVVTYFDRIEPGMYRVHYFARATSVGTFVAPPTRIEAMYEPEIYGRTAASTLTVRPK